MSYLRRLHSTCIRRAAELYTSGYYFAFLFRSSVFLGTVVTEYIVFVNAVLITCHFIPILLLLFNVYFNIQDASLMDYSKTKP